MNIELDWADMKANIVARNLSLQYFLKKGRYEVLAFDGELTFKCKIAVELILAEKSAEQIDFESNFLPNANKGLNQTVAAPFKSKTIGNKKLFGRTQGKSFSVTPGVNILDFTIPYNACKMTDVSIINGEIGDYTDFFVLDTATGTYSTIPNYPLNQFGFSVNISSGFFIKESRYDADLYVGMTISLVYNSQTAKTVYINYGLHEVV